MSEPTSKPALDGFTVEWDDLNKAWVAVSAAGNYRIVGRGQPELEGRRWELYGQLIAQFRAAMADLFPRGGT
jgi:hypothetical protein